MPSRCMPQILVYDSEAQEILARCRPVTISATWRTSTTRSPAATWAGFTRLPSSTDLERQPP
jgi:hypothetical protein